MIPDVLDQPRPYPGPVISLYLNRDGLPSAPRIRELLKSIRASAAQASHEDAMSIRADSEAVEQLATKLDRTAAASVGIFACGAVGVMEVVELSEPVWDVAVVDTVPYLRPLRAVAETGPVAVAVVERGRAWVFSVDQGSIDKLADIEEQLSHPKNPDEGLKRNYGGWHGYAERRARAHAGAKTQRHFQEAARLISELDEKHRFGYVVVGGH